MALTRNEQTEALTCLLREDFDGYGRLVEDSKAISQASKIELLYQGLRVAGLRVRVSSSDEQVIEAMNDLTAAITKGSNVVEFRLGAAE